MLADADLLRFAVDETSPPRTAWARVTRRGSATGARRDAAVELLGQPGPGGIAWQNPIARRWAHLG